MPDQQAKRRIVATTALPTAVEAALAARFTLETCVLREVGRDAFLSAIGAPDALIVAPGDPITGDLIEHLPASVGMIASYSTGIDHIDSAAAAARGIVIARTPGVLTDATADIALLLILMMLRGVASAQRLISGGGWKGWRPDQIFGHDVAGRKLGIVGPGAIGLATAQRAAACGMGLAYWGRSASPPFAALGAERITNWYAFLGAVDVVSLHVPATPEKLRIIDHDAIDHMRPGACLVNTARGELIDDDAVLVALASGRLGGVGLDVSRGEPTFDPRWHSAPNTVLLPHMGSATDETRAAMGHCVLAALQDHFDLGPPGGT